MHLEHIIQEPTTRRYNTPILFVHGAYHAAWCWQEHFMPYFLEQGYTVHALSFRNHGQSDAGGSIRWRRGAEYVADVHQIVEKIGTPPILIGHSMGGYVVQKYLERHPAHAAVLVASLPPSGVLRTALSLLWNHPLEFLKANLTISLWPIIGTPELAQASFFPPTMSREAVAAYHAKMQDESFLTFLDMMFLNLPRPSRVKKVPMFVVGGEIDQLFRPYQVEATGRAYNAPVKLFPGVAHDMMLDPQWKAVAESIAAWLATVAVRA